MRPSETNRPARYHRGHMDTEWQKDLILPFQLRSEYRMPVELTDPFRFQLKSTPFDSHSVKLVDCNGVTVHTFTLTTSAAIAGDVTADLTQYTHYHYSIADWTAISGLAEGIYYILYTIAYTVSDISVFISEPLDIRAHHRDTILIEYWHDSYKYGIPFSTIPSKFRLRVKGYVDSFVPKSISTAYQDQNSDTDTLDYAPYRAWRLYVGRDTRQRVTGIADWMLDKLNRILGCDHILIDGKAFTASTANPSWNIQSPTSTPLKVADIEIQEAEDAEDFTFSDTSFVLYNTGTYPLGIGHIGIGGYPVAGAIRLADATAENTAITAWNSGLTTNELSGTISKVGSVVYYNNGPGEKYTYADVTAYTLPFSFGHTPPSANALTVTLGNSTGLISWGDGTVEEVLTGPNTAITHNYSATGIYTVEIYGRAEVFYVAEANTSNLTGTMPAQLRSLSVQNMSFASNTFDFAVLSNCQSSLTTLLMAGNGLTTTSNMPTYNFTKLANVQFSGNALTQTAMNTMIANVKNNAYANGIVNGVLNVAVQSPAVFLNATGSAAKSALQAIGWSVYN